jgi:hypothetical protein
MRKASIILLLVSSALNAGSLSSDEITNMISEIKEERVGISLSKLENTQNPFLINKQEKAVKHKKEEVKKVTKEIVYNLQAILNHAAFINGKWYKRGDKLGLYRIIYIGKESVSLASELERKTLSIKKRKNKFIKLNKGTK